MLLLQLLIKLNLVRFVIKPAEWCGTTEFNDNNETILFIVPKGWHIVQLFLIICSGKKASLEFCHLINSIIRDLPNLITVMVAMEK